MNEMKNIHIYTESFVFRAGVLSLLSENNGVLLKNDVHIFDLRWKSHPLFFLQKLSSLSCQENFRALRFIVVCDEKTKNLYRKHGIRCVSATDSLTVLMGAISKASSLECDNGLENLFRYYSLERLGDLGLIVIRFLNNGFSVNEISEISGVSSKTLYSRIDRIKNEFGINKSDIPMAHSYFVSLMNDGVNFVGGAA